MTPSTQTNDVTHAQRITTSLGHTLPQANHCLLYDRQLKPAFLLMMKFTFFFWGGLLITISTRASAFVPSSSSSCRPSISAARRSLLQLSQAAVVDISENASRDIYAMEDWATNCGVQKVDGFELTSQDGVDWSVMTSQPLQEDTTVLAIPESLILSSGRARQDFYNEAAEDLLGRLDETHEIPLFYLFLNVLAEWERGDESPWFPWLNSLPRWYDNGASMTRKRVVLQFALL